MIIGIVNHWLGYAGCSQKYDWTPSFLRKTSSSLVLWISGYVTRVNHRNKTGRYPFCETLQVDWYCESVARLRGLITEIRQDAFLSVKPFKFFGIVNQWLGDASWSLKYDRATYFLRNPWSESVAKWRGLFIEIRQDAFVFAKPFKFICIANQLLGYEGLSQKYDRTPSFLRNPSSSLVLRLSG
jgi:hypothetical protein